MKLYAILAVVLLFNSCNPKEKNTKKLTMVNTLESPVTLPYEMVNGLIVIKLQINNSKPLNFVLDTGAPITCILESDRAIGFQDPLSAHDEISSHTETYMEKPVKFIDGLHLKLNNSIFLKNLSLGLWPPELFFKHSSYNNVPYDGIIGYDLLKFLVLEVNQEHKTLTLYNPKKDLPKNDWAYSDLEFINNKPYCNINLRIKPEDEKIPLKVHFDLGNMNYMWVKTNPSKNIIVPVKRKEQVIGMGIDGKPMTGTSWPIHSLEIAGLTNWAVPTRFSSTGHSRDKNREGHIGLKELERFNLLIDYNNKRLGLRPIEETFVINDASLKLCEGTYASPSLPYAMILEGKRNVLYFKAEGKNPLPLVPINNGKFSFKPMNISIIFPRDKDGKIDYTKFTLKENKKELIWTRL
ncbi:pepsin/retropepsin-like aspartic protease family protein [Seonamhaeicola marinus]|uniref:Peptidase A2 domain-containing protein n=1 Tax=Seonamhaeicola marinus TaxID=1912246 RepID=A0A5D0JBM6_9FLAO|nr:hypothetical protein [Seonamhaeicola marinus]TYA92278.1 hypothetical protein FUA24_02265 [Seonamhaeicola marinus]